MRRKWDRIQKALEHYYMTRGRRFPWRESRNAFELYVAEIMLQKTPAERVAAIFRSFIERYRSCKDILEKEGITLEEYFQRLGLKKRARWILETCRIVEGRYGGVFPTEEHDLMTLKGCGEYCSRALIVALKGIGKMPVDSNVRRITKRIFGERRLKEIKNLVITREAFYGLLDLASDLCLHSKTFCENCPVKQYCLHYDRLTGT